MQSDNSLSQLLGQTDIYLLDQVMKGRYNEKDKILDAGCGPGRNMHWFLQNNFEITGIDQNEEAIGQLRSINPGVPEKRFLVAPVEKIPFPDHYFGHVISSAVLHFARDTGHFRNMLREMVRVLQPGGSLFIRMTSNIGIEDKVILVSDGVYDLPDDSRRFLLTRNLLADCMKEFNLSFLEPLKTVNVDDIRCMSTLVLQKK